MEADSRRRPRGRRGARAAPLGPPRIPRTVPGGGPGPRKERQGLASDKRRCENAATDASGHLAGAEPEPPLPPHQRPAQGGDGSPVHASLRAALQAGSPQLEPGGAKAPKTFWHPAVPDGTAALCSAVKKHAVANSTQSLHPGAPGRSFLSAFPPSPPMVPNLGGPRDQLIRQGGQSWHP